VQNAIGMICLYSGRDREVALKALLQNDYQLKTKYALHQRVMVFVGLSWKAQDGKRLLKTAALQIGKRDLTACRSNS